MSDLSHLFPNLNLDDWNKGPVEGDGHDDPSHGGVTDEDIESYLTRMGSLRAPLGPVVSGQQAPLTPEFANNGRAVPPGGSAVVEPAQQVEPSVPPAMPEGSPEGEPVGEASPPAPPPPSTVEIGGRTYDRAQAEAWAQFDQMLAQDPQLQKLLTDYLSGNRQPPQQQQEPQQQSLPELPEHYAEDEVISGMYKQLRQQQEVLSRVDKQSQLASEMASSNIQRQYTEIAQSAMDEFQRNKQLDDDTMAKVVKTGHTAGFAARYMQGTDPLTGVPVRPDPYKATMTMLEAGYLLTPETKNLETDREVERRAVRAKEEADRKRKLAGVSGASGSVPRTQSIPNNPQDARAAMVSEVGSMLNGNWPGDGN